MRSAWGRISSRSVRSCWKVCSWLCPRRHVRFGGDLAVVLACPQAPDPGAGVGSEARGEQVVVGAREFVHGVDPEFVELGRGLLPDAPQRLDGPRTHERRPLLAREPEHAPRLRERAPELGAMLRVAHADRAPQVGTLEHLALHLPGERLGIVGLHRHERLVPPEHLHDRRERPQGVHHARARLQVVVGVDREEHAVGTSLQRRAQRHRRPHAELTGFVGGGGDDPTLGGVAVTAHDHGLAPQLGMPEHLDRGDELVHVDVEDPAGHPPSMAHAADVEPVSSVRRRGTRCRWCP